MHYIVQASLEAHYAIEECLYYNFVLASNYETVIKAQCTYRPTENCQISPNMSHRQDFSRKFSSHCIRIFTILSGT